MMELVLWFYGVVSVIAAAHYTCEIYEAIYSKPDLLPADFVKLGIWFYVIAFLCILFVWPKFLLEDLNVS